MAITNIGGMELSRATILAMRAAERAERAEERERWEAAEARREAAEVETQRYYAEHGEWEWETRAREQDALARAEARAQEKRRIERADRHQADLANWIAAGRQPRSLEEILAVAALYP